MDNFAHTDLDNSSITGVENSAGLNANTNGKSSGLNPQLVMAAKRQSYLKREPSAHRKLMETASFLAMIEQMGPQTLHTPFIKAQLDDLRHGDQPDGHHSATLVHAIIAGAQALPYAPDMAMDLLAANRPNMDVTPVAPRLDLDDAA